MKYTVFTFWLTSFMLIGFGTVNTAFAQKKSTTIATNNKVTAKVLQEILDKNKHFATQGKVADYIPELGKMNPNAIAFSVVDADGNVISVGDVSKKFTIQSISKIIALMIAVQEKGESEVFKNMGYYGTHQPFNHFANLEVSGKPLNPMMNAGAILTTSMIAGEGEIPFQKILNMIRFITKNNQISLNETVFLSEKETGHRNRGMFYLLKNNGLIHGTEEQLDTYFKQCSIEVTTEDLAKIAYFFANGCVRFDGDATYKNTEIAQLIQSQMLIAGMYEFSGEYARRIGLPSKSGVGGGIAACVPGKMGIGVFSAPLDSHGNSIAGYQMILDLATQFGLNVFLP